MQPHWRDFFAFAWRVGSGGEFGHDLFRRQFAPVVSDKHQFSQRFALFAIDENGAAFVFREQKFIAPLGQGNQHGLQGASLVGQDVFLPGAAVGGGRLIPRSASRTISSDHQSPMISSERATGQVLSSRRVRFTANSPVGCGFIIKLIGTLRKHVNHQFEKCFPENCDEPVTLNATF